MKKTTYHGICVIEKIGGGIIGLACTIKYGKKLPKQNHRIIGNNASTTYWFDDLLASQTFYNNTYAKIKTAKGR